MNRRNFSILLGLAALARLPMLFDHFWYDENFTLALVRLPFDRMLAAVIGDVHPPLFYVIAWMFGHWGGPAWLVRLPSFIAGLAALVVFRAVLDQLSLQPKTQQAALILLAFAPMQLHYDSEARMYALLLLLVLCCVWAILAQRMVLQQVALIALVYTHNWGLIYAASLAALAMLYPWSGCDWRSWKLYLRFTPHMSKRYLAPFLPVLLAWLPWAFVMRSQMGTIAQAYWITRVSPGQLAYYVFQQVWSVALPNPVGFMVTWAWLVIGLVAMWKTYFSPWRVTLLAFLPLLLGVIVSLAWQPVIIFRALIGTAPFLYIILAAPFEWIYERRAAWHHEQPVILRRALLAAVFLAPLVILAYPSLYAADFRGDNTIKVADYLKSHMRPGDLLVVGGDGGVINMLPYGYSPIMMTECGPALGGISPATRAAIGFDIRPWSEIHAKRIWLFWGTTPLLPQCAADEFHAVVGQRVPVLSVQHDALTDTALWLVEEK